MDRKLRDESTPEGRAIWADVDRAAARCPAWVLAAIHRVLMESEHGEVSRSALIGLSKVAGKCEASPYDLGAARRHILDGKEGE